jgi:RNA polymerase sigma factor (sigma-70 family)
MNSPSWPQIYAALRQDPGNEETWPTLDERVRSLVRQRLPDLDPSAVEDAAAEICLRVVTDLDKARGAATFQGFVFGQFLTLRRRILAHEQARRAEVPIAGLDFPSPADKDPGESELAKLRQCLNTLLPRDRRAVELRYFQQASPTAIATTLTVSEGNARRIVFNGLTRLRTCMGARTT